MTKYYISRSEWLFLIFAPFIWFPVFWSIATAVDWIYGDNDFILRMLYASKGELLNEILTDWLSSIPICALFLWAVFLPLNIILRFKNVNHNLRPIIAGISFGAFFAVWLYSIDFIGILILTLSGLLLSTCLLFMRRIMIHYR